MEEKNIFVSPAFDGPLKFEGNKVDNLKLEVRENKSHSYSRIKVPYSVKLLIQECGAMGINLKLITENTKTNFLNFKEDLDKSKKVESQEKDKPVEDENLNDKSLSEN